MFCEDLVCQIKKGINVTKNMELLYTNNLGLIGEIANDYGVYDYDLRNDFFQLAYLALDDAVHAYKAASQYSFLSFFRRCLMHQYYVYRLEMMYPLKITRNAYNKHELNESFLHVDESLTTYAGLLESFAAVEDSMLCDALWNEVHRVLTDKNYYVIIERYKHNKSLKEIAQKMNIGSERVRLRELRSLDRLRKDKYIQTLARDFYNIGND